MPVRRTRNKRRASADIEAWALYLESGFDYFSELIEVGVTAPGEKDPPLAAARAAWLAYGPELLERWAAYPDKEQGDPWAVQQFGVPRAWRRR